MITYEEFNDIIADDEKFTEWFHTVLSTGEVLAGDCWESLYYEGMLNEVETIKCWESEGRWCIPADIIFEFEGKYYCISFAYGKTEEQPNEWDDQSAIPVKKVEVKTYQWVAE